VTPCVHNLRRQAHPEAPPEALNRLAVPGSGATAAKRRPSGKRFDVVLEVNTERQALPPGRFADNRKVTEDQAYLRRKINSANEESQDLTYPALQRLTTRYGTAVVIASMRLLHGFPPPKPIRSLYAYLESMCKQQS
jgi:hypothetical protein